MSFYLLLYKNEHADLASPKVFLVTFGCQAGKALSRWVGLEHCNVVSLGLVGETCFLIMRIYILD